MPRTPLRHTRFRRDKPHRQLATVRRHGWRIRTMRATCAHAIVVGSPQWLHLPLPSGLKQRANANERSGLGGPPLIMWNLGARGISLAVDCRCGWQLLLNGFRVRGSPACRWRAHGAKLQMKLG